MKQSLKSRLSKTLVLFLPGFFLLNFFIMMPPPIDILKGMLPNLPEVPADAGSGPFLVIASSGGLDQFHHTGGEQGS